MLVFTSPACDLFSLASRALSELEGKGVALLAHDDTVHT